MSLDVLWSAPDDGTRCQIGKLWREDDGGYAFAYAEDLKSALAKGFTLLPAFPEDRKEATPYRSAKLFPTFAQRVPSDRRPDFGAFLDAWRLLKSDDPLVMLAVSGGTQVTDRIELAEMRAESDDLSRPLTLRVAGQKHYDGASDVRVGDVLRLQHESENAFDPHATQILLLAHDKTVGYVPRQYSKMVANLLDAGIAVRVLALRQLQMPHDPSRWVVRLSRQT